MIFCWNWPGKPILKEKNVIYILNYQNNFASELILYTRFQIIPLKIIRRKKSEIRWAEVTGLQIAYHMTNQLTINVPTQKEQIAKHYFDSLIKATWQTYIGKKPQQNAREFHDPAAVAQ